MNRPGRTTGEMTLLEHLEELRRRLLICLVAVAGGLLLAVALPIPGHASPTWLAISLLVQPLGGGIQAIKPAETLFTYFRVALMVGAGMAMPVIVYQGMAFVLPGLMPGEKKILLMAVPGITIAFVLGVVFGYLVFLPFTIRFLLNFGAELIPPNWSFSEYLGLVTALLFWLGVAFELPLVILALTKLGVVTVEQLAGWRKWALLLSFVAGALITPTPDPLNQTMVSVPIYLLFELGLLLSRILR